MPTSLKRHKGFGGLSKIPTKLRYDPKSAEDLTVEQIAFGKSMQHYLSRWDRRKFTAGMVLDVAMDLGYQPPCRDFKKCVKEFAAELAKYTKRRRIKFPAWSEILGVMISCGWKPPQKPAA